MTLSVIVFIHHLWFSSSSTAWRMSFVKTLHRMMFPSQLLLASINSLKFSLKMDQLFDFSQFFYCIIHSLLSVGFFLPLLRKLLPLTMPLSLISNAWCFLHNKSVDFKWECFPHSKAKLSMFPSWIR